MSTSIWTLSNEEPWWRRQSSYVVLAILLFQLFLVALYTANKGPSLAATSDGETTTDPVGAKAYLLASVQPEVAVPDQTTELPNSTVPTNRETVAVDSGADSWVTNAGLANTQPAPVAPADDNRPSAVVSSPAPAPAPSSSAAAPTIAPTTAAPTTVTAKPRPSTSTTSFAPAIAVVKPVTSNTLAPATTAPRYVDDDEYGDSDDGYENDDEDRWKDEDRGDNDDEDDRSSDDEDDDDDDDRSSDDD